MSIADALPKVIDLVEKFVGAAMKIIDPVFELVSTVPAWAWLALLLTPAALFGFVYLRSG